MFHSKLSVDPNVNHTRKSIKKRNKNGPLSLKQIELYMKSCHSYLGALFVKSFKNLLLKVKKYSLIVYCNAHWFCIYSTRTTFEIFDPLGFLQKSNCLSMNFMSFLKTHIKGKILYCNPKIQSDNSNYCGFYVIFFIRMREMGHSFVEILRKFSKNFQKNDSLVQLYVKKIYEA